MRNIKMQWISNTEQNNIGNTESHYQELDEIEKERVYQKITQH